VEFNPFDVSAKELVWDDPAAWRERFGIGLAGPVEVIDSEPGMVQRMADRINSEPRPRAAKLWTATYLLMGLRYPDDLVTELLGGIQGMRESTTYQAILREGRQEGQQEGRVEGEQRMLLHLGTKRFGQPDAHTIAAIEAIQNIDRLEAMGERILEPDLRDWDDRLRAP
jgi:hypothetical protein